MSTCASSGTDQYAAIKTALQVGDLTKATEHFFSQHWNQEVIGQAPPQWLHWQELRGSAPNYDLGGCNALFEGESLVYVGIGVSKGGGRYQDHGISRRLMRHVFRGDREKGDGWLKPRVGWEQVTSIYTIGSPKEFVHVACALESFLIRSLGYGLRNARV